MLNFQTQPKANNMDKMIDIGLMELLTSKICHDLISPIGAVANGVEFMEEMGADAGEEATSLIKFSALQASAKLQSYRMAYGAGGGDTSIKPEDVHTTFNKFIELDKKIKQDWNPYGPLGPEERSAGFSKLLMCALILCAECLPKGGTIKVEEAGANITRIKASGEDAALKEPMAAALDHSMPREAVEPRYVHAYITHLLADQYGFELKYNGANGETIEFLLRSPQ
ncbi:MAG: histidine phosphotransferase family protein [Alphaproteobacteria bacterium]